MILHNFSATHIAGDLAAYRDGRFFVATDGFWYVDGDPMRSPLDDDMNTIHWHPVRQTGTSVFGAGINQNDAIACAEMSAGDDGCAIVRETHVEIMRARA